MAVIRIFRAWLKWRKNWEDLCTCCGKCCYVRHTAPDGQVIIDYARPCEYLDTVTKLCRVYPERFQRCSHCRKVTLWVSLFNPTLPNDCPYATTFRLWKKKEKKAEAR
ncbi:MAG: hypothetical protein LUD72_01425 [Bacteroidales bacterium]|nr:hypothetical protein [Bacteroidales bacterium]